MWSDLPQDLLRLVSETLTLLDLVRFAFVCRSWRSAAAVKDRCRRQAPWLLFAGEDDSAASNFYSLSDDKIFSIPNQPGPPMLNRLFIGAGHGWLITADERSELSLLNPITRQQINLPPISTLEQISPHRRNPNGEITEYLLDSDHSGRYIIERAAEVIRFCIYVKATVSSSPGSGDYIVALILRQPCCLAFARSGDDKWTIFRYDTMAFDLVFHDDGRLYATMWSGEVRSWDFSKSSSLMEPSLFISKPPKFKLGTGYLWYLARTPRGTLFQVRKARDEEMMEDYGIGKIEVHKIDLEKRRLVRMKSIGDHVIFVGANRSICVSSKDVPGVKRNCVYFTDEFLEFTQSDRDSRRDIGVFHLEDGSTEPILPDKPQLNWPPPIWFMPSFP